MGATEVAGWAVLEAPTEAEAATAGATAGAVWAAAVWAAAHGPAT